VLIEISLPIIALACLYNFASCYLNHSNRYAMLAMHNARFDFDYHVFLHVFVFGAFQHKVYT